MTDKLRDAAEAALEAWDTRAGIDTASKAFEAIRAALAESEVKPAAWMYQVRFTDPPDSEWRYYGLYRSKSQADAMVDRHDHADDIEGRLVPLYPHPPKDQPPMTGDEVDAAIRARGQHE